MKENNYDVKLSNINDIFDNKTLRYRIDGFACAIGMENVKVFKNSGVIISGDYTTDNGYYIFSRKGENNSDKFTAIDGFYNGLIFVFKNFYKKENLDKRIIDLPYELYLKKDIYTLNMKTIDGVRTKFIITKYPDDEMHTSRDVICFYANIMDFSEVLKLVKSFVNNPDMIFNTYDEIRNKKTIVFTSKDVRDGFDEDEKLNKPTNKVKKIIKFLTNNN